MATIFDVAKYILEKQGTLSTWKLQKLCYYCQTWAIAWTENHLFEQDFQAWTNGPVCWDLFQIHRGKYLISAADISQGDSSVLNNDQQETIDIVLKHYGNWSPFALREQTHAEQPWKQARGNLPEDATSSKIITKKAWGNTTENCKMAKKKVIKEAKTASDKQKTIPTPDTALTI